MPYRPRKRADSEDGDSDDRVTYWVPSDGIEYDVIAANIVLYLGPDASVEKRVGGPSRDMDIYYVRSSRAITMAMLLDLKRDTCEWINERKSDPGISYVASRTYCKHHHCQNCKHHHCQSCKHHHCQNCNALGAVSKATESRVFERVSLPSVGFRERQIGGISNQASRRDSGALCASSGRFSLASLRDVHLYLTEIAHVVGEEESEACEIYLECVRLKSFVRALRRLHEQATKYEWVTQDH